MRRIAIVEDDRAFAEKLIGYLEQYGKEKNMVFQARYFQDGEDIVEKYKSDFDLILMDIQMRFLNGLDAARQIREADNEVLIVFITNEAQFAIDGYAVRAFDYLVKPLSYGMFRARMDRITAQMKQKMEDFLLLPLSDGAQRVEIRKILYVESHGHIMEIHTREGITETRLKMGDLEERLAERNFYRCHKGYLVNLEEVDRVEEDTCQIGDEIIPVSRRRKTEFLERLARII